MARGWFNMLICVVLLDLTVSIKAVLDSIPASLREEKTTVLRRLNHAPIPGIDTISQWVALGDSFSAGPGAGSKYPGSDRESCYRRLGAYAPLMKNSTIFIIDYDNPQFNFRSCSGDVTTNVIGEQVQYVDENKQLVTLSIGGNDIDFSAILKKCVFTNPLDLRTCTKTISDGRDKLYSAEFYNNHKKILQEISTRLRWPTQGSDDDPPKRTTLFQTTYPAFFDSWTGQCNEAQFLFPISDFMTNERREELNLLGQEVNYAISQWIDYYNWLLKSDGADAIQFAKFVDQDEYYQDHRFCREGVIEPVNNLPKTWFFNLGDESEKGPNDLHSEPTVNVSTLGPDQLDCSQPPPNTREFTFEELACAIREGIENNQTVDPIIHESAESTAKTFHPKIAGFAATRDEVIRRLNYRLPEAGGLPHDKQFRIMAMGDLLTIGSASYADGYRKKLYEILTAGGSNNAVGFVGSTTQGSGPSWNNVEASLTRSLVSEILDDLRNRRAVATWNPNVVLLMAGSFDVNRPGVDWQSPDLNTTRNTMYELIDEVFDQCNDCTVLLGQIPPIGNVPSGVLMQWPPSTIQRRAMRYNAMLAEVVNKQRKLNHRKLLKVHLSNTIYDHIDDLYPSQEGYEGMAYDWAERLSDADASGYIAPLFQTVTIVSTASNTDNPSATGSSSLTETPILYATPYTTSGGTTLYTTVSETSTLVLVTATTWVDPVGVGSGTLQTVATSGA